LGGAALTAGSGLLWPGFAFAKGHDDRIEASYYERLPKGEIRCDVCPLHCRLKPGETCYCRTRTNHNGVLFNHAYNSPCIINVDPIEKTPLLHFLPGKEALALGLAGCNMRCLYCQNWQVSQEEPVDTQNKKLTAKDAVDRLKKYDLPAVALTYTEPVAFFEYARDVAEAAGRINRKAIMASAAFIEAQPMKDLCACMHGMCLAIKGFNEMFYKKVCGVKLAPVLKAIEIARAKSAWLELTTLVIPTYNDKPEEIRAMSEWIAKNLGRDVPLHFTRFVPEYKMRKLPQTPVPVLERCREIALAEGLRYVYIGNVAPHPGNHTYCPKCDTAVIKRVGFKVLENNLIGNTCPKCKNIIPGIFS